MSAEKVYFTSLRGYGWNFPTDFGLAVAWCSAETPTYRCALTAACPETGKIQIVAYEAS